MSHVIAESGPERKSLCQKKKVKGEAGIYDVMSNIFQLTQEANVKAKEITYRKDENELS